MSIEKEHSITRKEFLKTSVLGMIGGALCAIGAGDGSKILIERYKKYREAERGVEAQGLTRPDKELWKLAEQMHQENIVNMEGQLKLKPYIPSKLNPDETRQANEAIIQHDRYMQSFWEHLDEKNIESLTPGHFAGILAGLMLLNRQNRRLGVAQFEELLGNFMKRTINSLWQ